MEKNKLQHLDITNVKWVRLGDYIEQCDEKNTDNTYNRYDVRGISIEKKVIKTKANMDGVDLTPYKIFKKNSFCYVTVTSRNSEKITIALNTDEKSYIVSSSYIVFHITDTASLLPEFLNLWFYRPEFNRYARFHSWGSAREVFSWDSLCDIEIPLPSIDEQQKAVNVWRAFREIKRQNEEKAAPLLQVCQSFLQELKHKYPMKEIGPYIEECNERNAKDEYGVNDLKGVTSESVFDTSKAKVNGIVFTNYKVVRKDDFAYNPSRINLGSIALSLNDTCIISPMYVVFRLKGNELLPQYLFLWFKRKEFQRSTKFFVSGSVRDTFGFKEMRNVKIPFPPIEIQRAIVNIYKCANKAKQIAEKADQLSREVCPALLQHIIHS